MGRKPRSHPTKERRKTEKIYESEQRAMREAFSPSVKVGDRVMYSRGFCRSVGLYASNDPLVHRSRGGEVMAIEDFLAVVKDAEGQERRVRVTNLVRTDALELD
jgi:hypothetical protein